MRDKFPKARCHALVVARDPGLRSIADLRAPQHMGLLTHMRRVGEDWARARRAEVGWQARDLRAQGGGGCALEGLVVY